MKGDWKEVSEMPRRELKAGELLMMALEIMKKHAGSFFVLAILVYLPTAAGQQYQLSRIVPTENMTDLARQMIPVVVWSAVLSFITMIGPMITAVMVSNELYGEEKMSFPRAFERGIRRWIAAAVTQGLILLGIGMFSIFIGIGIGGLPVLSRMAGPVLLLFILYCDMMQHCSAAMASLHGLTAWRCLAYIRSVFRERIFRGVGIYALFWILGNLPGQLISWVTGELLVFLKPSWLAVGVSTVIQAILGIFTLFAATGGILMLLNYESLRQQEWLEKNSRAKDRENF